jgi:hypothetical protein
MTINSSVVPPIILTITDVTPNYQYLCIVPDRSKNIQAENVFLPFEGDAGLSIILSKALLLADDDKITDPTILSQLKRK